MLSRHAKALLSATACLLMKLLSSIPRPWFKNISQSDFSSRMPQAELGRQAELLQDLQHLALHVHESWARALGRGLKALEQDRFL